MAAAAPPTPRNARRSRAAGGWSGGRTPGPAGPHGGGRALTDQVRRRRSALTAAWPAPDRALFARPLTSFVEALGKGVKGFVVLPRRSRVERTLGWIMNARRNARDYEHLSQHSEAHLNRAPITLMTQRLTRKMPTPGWS
jgi:transposase